MTFAGQVAAEEIYASAYAHYESGKWAEAARLFRSLCSKSPLDGRFWFGLGATLQQGKHYKDALQAWAMAALLKEEDPYPHFHAAECYLSLQEREEAAKALCEAKEKAASEDRLQERIAFLQEQWKME